MAFITLNDFIKKQYNSNKYKDKYQSMAKFVQMQGQLNLFNDWIEEIKGASLTLAQTNAIAQAYVKYTNTSASGIANVMQWLQKHNSNQLPMVQGILSTEYWVNKLKSA